MNVKKILLVLLVSSTAALAASSIDSDIEHQGFGEYTGNLSEDPGGITVDGLSTEYGGEFSACCGVIQPVTDPEEFSADPHPSDNVITLASTCDAASTKKYYVDFENARVYTCSRQARKELKRNPEKYLAEIAEQMNDVEDEPVEMEDDSDMDDAVNTDEAVEMESGNTQTSESTHHPICTAPTCYRM